MTNDVIQPPEGSNYWKKRPGDDSRRDWRTGGDWVTEYWNSQDHPHRKLILDTIKSFPPVGSVLEIGCNCGPNLGNIKREFPDIELAGVDINANAVVKAKELLPEADVRVHDIRTGIPWARKYDIILADAVLMYLDPEELEYVLPEMNRAANIGIIIVDWYDESMRGVVKDGHWARDYSCLLKVLGHEVETIELTQETWPNERWAKYGRIFIGRRDAMSTLSP